MGNFYANITTKKVSTDKIIEYLKSNELLAYIAKGPNDYCTIYEEICDEQDTQHISSLLEDISKKFECSAIGFINHDDDILAYELWEKGEKVDEYVSCPGYFEGDESRMTPEGGNAKILTTIMGNGSNVEEIERILGTTGFDNDDFSFAIDRHRSLAKLVGLPEHSVGYGFRYLSEGEAPENVPLIDISKIDG